MITDEQVDLIGNEISESGITSAELKDDLLDHMCCLIEIDMKKGLDFEQAYQKAFLQTSPNGYGEIQNETFFLLNYNKIMNMKRLTYISGFLFALIATIGLLFKLLHWPGATLFLIGLLGMASVFVPLVLINKFKTEVHAVLSEKMKWVLGASSFLLFCFGGVFKILHLPGSVVLVVSAFVIFGFGFLPFLFFRMYKTSIESA
ncbi:MAG: hypothetical protein ABJ004_03040 [Cyclobacteriaceae bacterium]